MSRNNRDDNKVLLLNPKRWYRRRRAGLIIAAAFAFVALLGIDALRRERLLHPRPLLMLRGHTGDVRNTNFILDGKFALKISEAGIVRLWIVLDLPIALQDESEIL